MHISSKGAINIKKILIFLIITYAPKQRTTMRKERIAAAKKYVKICQKIRQQSSSYKQSSKRQHLFFQQHNIGIQANKINPSIIYSIIIPTPSFIKLPK
jgi:hypothetical protein